MTIPAEPAVKPGGKRIDQKTGRRDDWVLKTLAGLIPGLGIALATAGIFAWAGPGGLHAPNKYQFVMWMIAPIWALIVSLCFLFPTGRDAWAGLGKVCFYSFAGLAICRILFG